MSSSLNHFIPPSFIFFRWSQVSTEKRLTNGNMISRDSTGKGDSVPCLIFTMWSHTVQSYYEVTVAINNQSRVHSLMKRRWKWQFTCMWDTIRVVALALCWCSCFFFNIYNVKLESWQHGKECSGTEISVQTRRLSGASDHFRGTEWRYALMTHHRVGGLQRNLLMGLCRAASRLNGWYCICAPPMGVLNGGQACLTPTWVVFVYRF